MMINLSLLILVLFAVFEMRIYAQYGDSPISPEEQEDLAKRFSAADLKRVRDLEIFSDRSILRSTSNGWTLDEMIKMVSAEAPRPANISIYCDYMFPRQNATTSFTSAQTINLQTLYNVTMMSDFIREADTRPFLRNFTCAYSAQPNSFDADADSFGSNLLLYMKIQFMKAKIENASGGERRWLIKDLCCLYQGQEDKIIGYAGLSEEDLEPFKNQWDEFASKNTSKSLEKFCKVLPFKDCPAYVFS